MESQKSSRETTYHFLTLTLAEARSSSREVKIRVPFLFPVASSPKKTGKRLHLAGDLAPHREPKTNLTPATSLGTPNGQTGVELHASNGFPAASCMEIRAQCKKSLGHQAAIQPARENSRHRGDGRGMRNGMNRLGISLQDATREGLWCHR